MYALGAWNGRAAVEKPGYSRTGMASTHKLAPRNSTDRRVFTRAKSAKSKGSARCGGSGRPGFLRQTIAPASVSSARASKNYDRTSCTVRLYATIITVRRIYERTAHARRVRLFACTLSRVFADLRNAVARKRKTIRFRSRPRPVSPFSRTGRATGSSSYLLPSRRSLRVYTRLRAHVYTTERVYGKPSSVQHPS